MKLNENVQKLPSSYLFDGVNARKRQAQIKWGDKLCDLGVGDVKLPLFKLVADEMKKACDEMTTREGFRGYLPPSGLPELKRAISDDYARKNVRLSPSEIFVSDGGKSQLSGILRLLKRGIKILFPTPCYPAGAEAALLEGNEVVYAPSDGDFIPYPPFGERYDAVFLCSPNNPSGVALDGEILSLWIDYALSSNALLVFDGAYADYVSDDYPSSIYEIPNADKCAVEIRSFSKGFGFTGLRLGYVVIPEKLSTLGALKTRFDGCSNNGVSYVVQRGGLACLSNEGRVLMKKRVSYYKANAEILRVALSQVGIRRVSGDCSPYVYAKCPDDFSDETFCAFLSDKLGVVASPGKGFFQQDGEYFRLSAFADRATIFKAADRLCSLKFAK